MLESLFNEVQTPEYRDYLRITPECFEERFEGRSILQNKLQMQEMQALHSKTNTCCENI